jgi:sec-independent protein translocase protein TatA
VIVIIFFGVGRLGEVGGAMGKGIREFRRAADGAYDSDKDKPAEEKAS